MTSRADRRPTGYRVPRRVRLQGAKTDTVFPLRIPPLIRRALRRASRTSGRSQNSEVLFALAKRLRVQP